MRGQYRMARGGGCAGLQLGGVRLRPVSRRGPGSTRVCTSAGVQLYHIEDGGICCGLIICCRLTNAPSAFSEPLNSMMLSVQPVTLNTDCCRMGIDIFNVGRASPLIEVSFALLLLWFYRPVSSSRACARQRGKNVPQIDRPHFE